MDNCTFFEDIPFQLWRKLGFSNTVQKFTSVIILVYIFLLLLRIFNFLSIGIVIKYLLNRSSNFQIVGVT